MPGNEGGYGHTAHNLSDGVPKSRCFEIAMHVIRRRVLATLQHQQHALTLVLRSTHSSQLSVGLLRFCFFLGGRSCPGVALVDGSGLVEGCDPSIDMMRAWLALRSAVGFKGRDATTGLV